jgi:probable DNA repair protein
MLLSKLGWPGDATLASEEFQASEAWGRLLSEFARLDAVGAQFTYGEALSRVRRLAAETVFQPESQPAPVQVLGALEAAGARFDHLWIAGMDDDSWPPPARPDPFLPAAVQRAHALPHSSAERELDFARVRTGRLLSAAGDVVVSHALHDGDRELGPSPLIRSIPQTELAAPDYPIYAEAIRASAAIERFEDKVGPPTAGDVSGGTSILRHQALCPFRAFAEVRLGAVALETPEEGLARQDRGKVVHAALDRLWGLLGSHERLCAGGVEDAIRESAAAALDEIGRRRGAPLPARFADLERVRLEALLAIWVEVERRRAPFVVAERELEREVELGGVRMKVRIDRIDRLEDGRSVILDYKTGEANAADWYGDRPSEPQVPLYATDHDGELAAAAFARLKTGKLGFSGIAADAQLLPGVTAADLSATLDEWRATLDALVARFRAGHAEVDPKKPATCRNCTLTALCRVAEVELDTSALSGEVN